MAGIFHAVGCSSLFFAVSGASTTTEKLTMQSKRNYIGTSDILIHANRGSPSPYFRGTGAEAFAGRMEYIIGSLDGYGYYWSKIDEKEKINLLGIEYKDLELMNPVSISEESNLSPFAGNKIIISTIAAEKFGLKLGNAIVLEISGVKHRFVICGVSSPKVHSQMI